ncbi:hypothetical protein [Propionibacterium cyclohexanicum]|nr:hypothetical protein [Propionibacterium cyclohexanicum]
MSGGIDRGPHKGPSLGERACGERARDRGMPQRGRAPAVSVVLVDGATPGLIARWRRTTDGWEGLVATVGGADDFTARWLPAARIAPMRLAP